jgi:hypothetical protein
LREELLLAPVERIAHRIAEQALRRKLRVDRLAQPGLRGLGQRSESLALQQREAAVPVGDPDDCRDAGERRAEPLPARVQRAFQELPALDLGAQLAVRPFDGLLLQQQIVGQLPDLGLRRLRIDEAATCLPAEPVERE